MEGDVNPVNSQMASVSNLDDNNIPTEELNTHSTPEHNSMETSSEGIGNCNTNSDRRSPALNSSPASNGSPALNGSPVLSASSSQSINEMNPEAETNRTPDSTTIPKEHHQLWTLLSLIPKKAQRGLLMQCDLILTCVDVNDNYIALGTNIGLVFLYDREKQTMERLKSDSSTDVVNCVKLHCGLDYQLAVAMTSGLIRIYLLPSKHLDRNKILQKVDVKDLHYTAISCLEWSRNGMKLFSGDKNGRVVVTGVDFYSGEFKSDILLDEDRSDSEIVQLCCDHKALLVSTKYRSIICRTGDTSGPIQIGQKERKLVGLFGACFVREMCKPSDAKLFACRPGCRIWLAKMDGTVYNTFIFKDVFAETYPTIPILKLEKPTQQESQFGPLYMYGEKDVVTWCGSSLFIIEPLTSQIKAVQTRMGDIIDVAINNDEIFVLRKNVETSLIRIADKPEVIKRPVFLSSSQSSSTNSSPSHSAASNLSKFNEELKQKGQSAKGFFQKNVIGKFKNLDFNKPSTKHLQNETSVKSLIDSVGNETSVKSMIGCETEEVRSPDLPPVVKLKTPELTGLEVFIDREASPSPEKVKSPPEKVTTPSRRTPSPNKEHMSILDSQSSQSSTKSFSSQPPDSGDIIFSQRVKKTKRKKNKAERKEKDTDSVDNISIKSSDNVSIKSFDSSTTQPDVEDKTFLPASDTLSAHTTGDALSRADDILKRSLAILNDDDKPSQSQVPVTNKPSQPQVPKPHKLNESSSIKQDSQSVSNTEPLAAAVINDVSAQKPSTSKDLDKQLQDNLNQEETPSVIENNVKHTDLDNQIKNVSSVPNSEPVVSEPDSQIETISVKPDNQNKMVPLQDSIPIAIPNASASQTTNSENSSSTKLSSDRNSLMDDPLLSGSYPASAPSTDDFYSIYKGHRSDSSVSSFSTPGSSQNPKSLDTKAYQASKLEPRRLESVEGKMDLTVNIFDEISTGANTYSLSVSESHVWFTDKSENIFYSNILGNKIVWRKAAGAASQVAVSSKGHIVWRLHRNIAYAGTKLTSKRPEGLKWVDAVKEVVYIAVDDSTAWYIKTDGKIMMQKGLSKERPCFRSLPVPCTYNVKQITCYNGVVWAITNDMKLIYRRGITSDCEEGTEWHYVNCGVESLLFGHVALEKNNGWAVDVLGGIWFVTKVSMETPMGNGKWSQVPINEYFLQDVTTLDNLKSLASKLDPQKLSFLISSNRGGLIAASTSGVWVCPEYKNILHVCRGNIQGFRWSDCPPVGMAISTVWKHLCVDVLDNDWGLVWAQQPNGDMYAFPPATRAGSMIALTPMMTCLSGCKDTIWGLTADGEVLARCGMGPYCPHGSNWATLNLSQLGDAHLLDLCCNNQYIWAVDSDGMVYQRIGSKAPTDQELSPVWLPLDSFSGIIFNHIAVGYHDWMVWATDTKQAVYVRTGITDHLPIGKEWINVPGIHAVKLTISKSGVWAINQQGEVFYRYGISEKNVLGDYWKKVPGLSSFISVSPNDELWSVSIEGRLLQCHSKYLQRRDKEEEISVRTLSVGSIEGEWELV